jgi:dTMP kinase
MIYLLWIAGVLALDQATKLLALAQLEPYKKVEVIDHLLYLTLTRNPGGAFGILRDHGLLVMVITAAISLGLLGALLFTRLRDGRFKLGLAIIAGGALGEPPRPGPSRLCGRLHRPPVLDRLQPRGCGDRRRDGPHLLASPPEGQAVLIAIEGLDGSGKTTQARLLAEYLRKRGKDVLLVEEPGTTPTGKAIRAILLDHGREILPLAELLLYEASRAQLVREVLEPALAAGKIVVADRFALSSLAYQGYGRGLPLELVQELNAIATGGLEPDLTILLDISPEEGLRPEGSARRPRGSGGSTYDMPPRPPRRERARVPPPGPGRLPKGRAPAASRPSPRCPSQPGGGLPPDRGDRRAGSGAVKDPKPA